MAVGLILQYLLGVFILRLEFGFKLFEFLGKKVVQFLDYTDSGSSLVFGTRFVDHYFAFKVMPVIIVCNFSFLASLDQTLFQIRSFKFFSAVANVCFYFGVVQYVFLKVGWVINKLMNTSILESTNSVANIFLGIVSVEFFLLMNFFYLLMRYLIF